LNLRRILVFALILAVVPQVLGFLQGIIVSSTWEWYGQDPQAVLNVSRILRRILVALVALVLYVTFLRGTTSNPAVATVILFLAATVLATTNEVALGSTIADAMPVWFILGHLLVAAIAFAGTRLVSSARPNTSLERTREG
jgi:hypothetical protein